MCHPHFLAFLTTGEKILDLVPKRGYDHTVSGMGTSIAMGTDVEKNCNLSILSILQEDDIGQLYDFAPKIPIF